MFTGIIESIGQLAALERSVGDARLRIDAGTLDLSDVKRGDSIAVNGVCLTVVELSGRAFSVDVSAETLSRTTIGSFDVGAPVNLEKALLPTTRLGGHLVSGHVDGVGIVQQRRAQGASIVFRIEVPAALAKYIAEKGSVCVDGASLTVNAVDGAVFDLNIIPHTAEKTTLGSLQTGQRVNIEVDLLARYLERLMLGERAAQADPALTREMLAQYGFIK